MSLQLQFTLSNRHSTTILPLCQALLSVYLKAKQNKHAKAHKMDSLDVNKQFNDWKDVLAAKKLYEESSKTVLNILRSGKLKGSSELKLNERLVYERVVFTCKAGPERPSKSDGHRKSATYKKNCPVQVNALSVMYE